MPRRPSRVDCAPSCMSPPALRFRSSQWSITGRSKDLASLHGAPHHARIHHRAAVVRDSHDARVLHGADGGQFLAGAVLGDGPDGKDVHHGMLAGALDDVAGDGGIVVHRQRVGHAADGGEAARRRRARAGLDGFGMLDARLAQMHVHVDEARAPRPARWHRTPRRLRVKIRRPPGCGLRRCAHRPSCDRSDVGDVAVLNERGACRIRSTRPFGNEQRFRSHYPAAPLHVLPRCARARPCERPRHSPPD